MKILHTSDWHLGHQLDNVDRTEEQMSMIQQMTDIVQKHKPDVFLICGDVYHTSTPSAAVQTMFSEAMVKLHKANPNMTIVVTAGNHDSGTKHDIFRTPWKALNVHTIGTLDKDNLDAHIVEVPNKGFVAAVPYTYERNIPEGYFQKLLDRVAERNTTGKLPVILTAHTTVNGCDFGGHDHITTRKLKDSEDSVTTVGGIDAVNINFFGQGYDYLALGHIHHDQFVHTGHHNVRYSGTPIAVSFDETHPHTVTLVKIDSHGEQLTDKNFQTIEIKNPHPLVTLPTDGFTSLDAAIEKLEQYPDDIPAYIRLNVEIENYLPSGSDERARKTITDNNKRCTFIRINSKRKIADAHGNENSQEGMNIDEFLKMAPIDLLKQYAADSQLTFDEEMQGLFNEAKQQNEEAKRNN